LRTDNYNEAPKIVDFPEYKDYISQGFVDYLSYSFYDTGMERLGGMPRY
jgi:hypothetical protein